MKWKNEMISRQGSSPWTVKVLTLFPDMFPGPLGASLAATAMESGIWSLETVDIRDFADNKHRAVDATPFGGGPGMVMRADVVDRAIEAAKADDNELPLIYFTPRGRPLSQCRVRELAAGPGAVLLCGRFEGIDERVIIERRAEEISLGDFILSGGEPAAMAMIDACLRCLPGVLGSELSLAEESFEDGLLEYPHYTRPRMWHDLQVPDVLTSGHHENIHAWRHAQAETITRERRPDLWSRYVSQKTN